MSEARTIAEDAARTIVDKGYIGQLVQKWRPFLEGLPQRNDQERYRLGVTAVLMENQSQYLKNMNEETRTTNVGSFTKYIFPVLRRVFPNLIANEIVSVQPMTAPIGAVFFLDYKYGTTKGAVTSGDVFPRDFNRNYSSEYIDGELTATGNGTDYGGAGTALAYTLTFKTVRPLNADRGFSVIIKQINNTTGAVVQQATDNGSGGFTGDVAAGAINYTTGAITAFKFTTAVTSGHLIKAFYFYDSELNSQVPTINLDVTKSPVEAISRKLKATWSAEAAEDLKAFQGADAETEIVSAIAREIALEIDRDIIQQLYAASTGTTAAFDRIPPSGISEVDHLRAMITQISTVSNLIHKKTLRSPANFIITSPEISALFSQLTTNGDFRPLYSPDMTQGAPTDMPRPMGQGDFGIYRVGTLMNKWTVYEDPFFTTNKMLVGLKGQSYLDAGFVWAPYVPLQVTPTFQDPADFSFRKGLRTRYATKLLRSEFYGQLTVSNI
jgi:hypothetical protein